MSLLRALAHCALFLSRTLNRGSSAAGRAGKVVSSSSAILSQKKKDGIHEQHTAERLARSNRRHGRAPLNDVEREGPSVCATAARLTLTQLIEGSLMKAADEGGN